MYEKCVNYGTCNVSCLLLFGGTFVRVGATVLLINNVEGRAMGARPGPAPRPPGPGPRGGAPAPRPAPAARAPAAGAAAVSQ